MAVAEAGERRLFTRRASGLVREVSVTNALFFNTAAFVGTGVGWYPVFYSLAFVPIGLVGFSTYGWAAIIVGGFGILLGLIFASLTTVMPRSGGDYVFTSRLIPGAGPFLGWVESFTLVFASLAIIAFEVPIVLRNLQITGRIIGVGAGGGFFEDANGWFAEDGVITGWTGFGGMLLVLLLIFLVVIQPTRRFHGIVTSLAALSLGSAVLMFVFGLTVADRGSFESNLPRFADGMTADQLRQAAVDNGIKGTGIDFDPAVFSFVAAIILLNYIGFQYSAYIAGEVRGNIKRGILIAVLGALVLAVLFSSVYIDVLSRHLGFDSQLGWGVLFWLGDPSLPLGQPNSLPLVASISTPDAWPLWALISLGGTLFPFLLCPVYLIFISRIALAWSLDRQIPAWFGEVNERLRTPLRAVLTALGIAVVLAALQSFPILPDSLAPPEGKLNLVATLWFSILMALLSWVMPGVNAIVGPFARRELLRNAPWRIWLPLIGIVWLGFTGTLYWFAGIKPIYDSIAALGDPAEESVLNYLNRTGITFTLGIAALAVVIFVIQWLRNRRAGIETGLMFREIPPD